MEAAGKEIIKGAQKALYEGKEFSPAAAARSTGVTNDYAEQISSRIVKNKNFSEMLEFVLPTPKILDIQARQMQAKVLRRLPFPAEIGYKVVQEGEEPDIDLAKEVIEKIVSDAGGVVSYVLPQATGGYLAFVIFDDHKAIDKALEKIYRLKGMNAPEEIKVKREFEDLSQDEIDVEIKKLEQEQFIRKDEEKKQNAIEGNLKDSEKAEN